MFQNNTYRSISFFLNTVCLHNVLSYGYTYFIKPVSCGETLCYFQLKNYYYFLLLRVVLQWTFKKICEDSYQKHFWSELLCLSIYILIVIAKLSFSEVASTYPPTNNKCLWSAWFQTVNHQPFQSLPKK